MRTIIVKTRGIDCYTSAFGNRYRFLLSVNISNCEEGVFSADFGNIDDLFV